MESKFTDIKVRAKKHKWEQPSGTEEFRLSLFVEVVSTGAFITVNYKGKGQEQLEYYFDVANSLKEDQSNVYLLLRIRGPLDDSTIEYEGIGVIKKVHQ